MFGLSYLKLGAIAAALLLIAALIGARQLAAAQRDAARAQLAELQAELREAVAVNLRNGDTIRELTVATKAAEDARDRAVAAAAARKTEIVTRTRTIIKEIDRVALLGPEPPVAPSLRAALAGLRARADSAPHGH